MEFTKKFDVVPKINPPDICWSRHDTEREAAKAAAACPHEAYVRVWTASDPAEIDALVQRLAGATPTDVEISRGRRHWDEIAQWREGAPLSDTIRVSVGVTTGIAEPDRKAVEQEIKRQRKAHDSLMPFPVDPWHLSPEERR